MLKIKNRKIVSKRDRKSLEASHAKIDINLDQLISILYQHNNISNNPIDTLHKQIFKMREGVRKNA